MPMEALAWSAVEMPSLVEQAGRVGLEPIETRELLLLDPREHIHDQTPFHSYGVLCSRKPLGCIRIRFHAKRSHACEHGDKPDGLEPMRRIRACNRGNHRLDLGRFKEL